MAKALRGGGSSMEVAPCLAGSSVSQRSASLCPSVLALQETFLWETLCGQHKHPSPPAGRGLSSGNSQQSKSKDSACVREGVLLLETTVAATSYQGTIPFLSPPLMWGWKDSHSTGPTPRTTSTPSELLPCLDFGVLPPLLLPLVKQLVGTLVWSDLHSPLRREGIKMPGAFQYLAQERWFSIYCQDIEDRGSTEAALREARQKGSKRRKCWPNKSGGCLGCEIGKCLQEAGRKIQLR